jgi:hypothetical protein
MSWIKRNLYFVIGSVVALALMGLAGWFLYSKWVLNNEILTNLNTDYEELRRLNSQKPHPGNEKINNIKAAKEQQQQLIAFVQSSRTHFQPIPRIPSAADAPKVTDRDFSAALSRVVDQLQKEATNSSISLPPNYNFSFEAEKQKVSFAPASLLPLATQLGEVKAICDLLLQAKINSLDFIRRERCCAEDSGTGGLQTDYLTEKATTNELAVLTPYEVTFRSFSSELGAVLAGFASSPHAFVVKTINVEPAPASAEPEPLAPLPVTSTYVTPTYAAPPVAAAAEGADAARARMAARYGLAGRYGRGGGPGAIPGGVQLREPGTPAPQPVYVAQQPTSISTSSKGGLPTVLDEKQLKVTINLIVVKLLPPK